MGEAGQVHLPVRFPAGAITAVVGANGSGKSSLEVPAREAISQAPRDMADGGMTVAYATHGLSEARRADHCALPRQGGLRDVEVHQVRYVQPLHPDDAWTCYLGRDAVLRRRTVRRGAGRAHRHAGRERARRRRSRI